MYVKELIKFKLYQNLNIVLISYQFFEEKHIFTFQLRIQKKSLKTKKTLLFDNQSKLWSLNCLYKNDS